MKNHPCIGNDVVDLGDPDCRDILTNTRFLERVFTRAERDSIYAAQNPLGYAWSAWACKESAYKALKRKDPAVVFSPSQFATDKRLSAIRYGNLRMACDVLQTEEFVLALCAVDGVLSRILSRFERLPPDVAEKPHHASDAARALMLSMLGNPHGISVSPPGTPNAPVLYRGNSVFSESISLSHHGRFVAAAAYWRAPDKSFLHFGALATPDLAT